MLYERSEPVIELNPGLGTRDDNPVSRLLGFPLSPTEGLYRATAEVDMVRVNDGPPPHDVSYSGLDHTICNAYRMIWFGMNHLLSNSLRTAVLARPIVVANKHQGRIEPASV